MNFNMMFPKLPQVMQPTYGNGLLPTPQFPYQYGHYFQSNSPLIPTSHPMQVPTCNERMARQTKHSRTIKRPIHAQPVYHPMNIPTINEGMMALETEHSLKNKFPIQAETSKALRKKIKPKRHGIGRDMEGVYMIVHNIPDIFHTDDLRIFFSQFIEMCGFVCFHFMHRPEIQTEKCLDKTTCCVIKVDPKQAQEFMEEYNGAYWVDKNGETLEIQCSIKKIVIDDSDPSLTDILPWQRPKPNYKIQADRDRFSSKNLRLLPEMRPPRYMPNGNVGTKLSYFQEMKGELPMQLARKLGLELKKNEGNSDQQKFKNRKERRKDRRERKLARRRLKNVLSGGLKVEKNAAEKVYKKIEKVEAVHLNEFAAFNKYSNGFGRKLMEAQGWKQGQGIGKNCSGMSEPLKCDGQKPTVKRGLGYEFKKKDQKPHPKKTPTEPGIISNKKEEAEAINSNEFAAFDKCSNGFGRKLMEAQGWNQGQGIGKDCSGMSEPIMSDGQKTTEKKGLGYEFKQENTKSDPKETQTHSDQSEIPLSTSTADPSVISSKDSVVTSNFKSKYNREFVKGQVININ